jgi:hypothetical protein
MASELTPSPAQPEVGIDGAGDPPSMTLQQAIDTMNQTAYDRGFTPVEAKALNVLIAAAKDGDHAE